MKLTTRVRTLYLHGAGVSYDSVSGLWEKATIFEMGTTDGEFLNPSGIHDFAVFGRLVLVGTVGDYPTGYDPNLFYYGFFYTHYVPNPSSLVAPTSNIRFGLAATTEDAMNRTPVIFSTGGSGDLVFEALGKFIKLATTVPECCDLPYFNERNLSLQNYGTGYYFNPASFDPETLNIYNNTYDNAVALHNQIDHDKIKKTVSFTISGITRNSFPPEPNTPYNYSLTVGQLNTEITEVIGWINTDHTLYHHSDSPTVSFMNSDSLVKAFHQQQYRSGALLGTGSISYHNARRRPQGYSDRYIIDRFTVNYGDLTGPFPTYTPDPDKILYRLTVSGQFHVKPNYMVTQMLSLTYELKESCSSINIGHLSGVKTLTLVPISGPDVNSYIDNIPSTIDVTFSGDDYSAEVLPASLTLVSPEKYLQDPCRLAGSMSGVGYYSSPSGLVIIDGIQTVEGDRILVTASSAFSGKGVWIASAGSWTRPTDYNLKYSYFEILEGTNAGKRYYLTESTGYVFSQFGVFPSDHNWTVNNYTDELPSSITLTKVAGYNNYEAEFTTAVNVRNYIRLKLTVMGYGFSFQQWTQDLKIDGYGGTYYEPSDALIEYFNESTGLSNGTALYTAPAEAKMLRSCSGLITIRLFKMAGMTNGSSSASENSVGVQYLLDFPLGITPFPYVGQSGGGDHGGTGADSGNHLLGEMNPTASIMTFTAGITGNLNYILYCYDTTGLGGVNNIGMNVNGSSIASTTSGSYASGTTAVTLGQGIVFTFTGTFMSVSSFEIWMS